MLQLNLETSDKQYPRNWKQKILGPSPRRKSRKFLDPTTPPSHTPIHSGTSSPFLNYSRKSSFSTPTQLSPESNPFRIGLANKFSLGSRLKSYSASSTDLLTPLNPLDDELDFHPLTNSTEPPFLKSNLPNKIRFNQYVTSIVELETKEPDLLPLSRSRGPKIQPFIFSQTLQPQRKSGPLVTSKCFICEELLQTKLESETFVELECGDFVHGECLKIVVHTEFESMPEAQYGELSHKFFQDSRFRKLVPLDDTLIDRMINDFLVQNDNSSPFSESLADPFNSPRKRKHSSEISTLNSIRVSTGDSSLHFVEKARSPSPNPSLSTTNTVSVQILHHIEIPIEVLKDHFVRYLLNCCENITLSVLLTLGPLRLVDRLLVGIDKLDSLRVLNCYLFSNFLVIWSPEEGINTIFSLQPGTVTIKTPKPNMVEIISSIDQILIFLNSEVSSIIEKWGVAISDPNFTFPSEILTSTIDVNDCKIRNLSLASVFSDSQTCRNSGIRNSVASLGSTLTIPTEGISSSSPTRPVLTSSDYRRSSEMSDHKILTQSISLDHSKLDQFFSEGTGNFGADLKPMMDSLHIDITGKMLEQEVDSSDSEDVDSDDEAITKALNCNSNGWNNLHARIDRAINSDAN